MKKYILVVGAALLTTAAVTGTVLSGTKQKTAPVKKEVKCAKMEKKSHCPKMDRTHCFD